MAHFRFSAPLLRLMLTVTVPVAGVQAADLSSVTTADLIAQIQQMQGSSSGMTGLDSADTAASPDRVGALPSVQTQPQLGTDSTANLRARPIIQSPNHSAPTPLYNTGSRMFGAQLFHGAFAASSGSTFNSSYVINPGDNVQVRMWGGYQYSGTLTVDAQGNIFVPNVGPVKVGGVSNGSLQSVVEGRVRQIYRANVGIYAALETAQPVKVLVTGFVQQPGNYGGVSGDSVLSYLDRAGGVDPDRGSYVDIQIRRNGRVQQSVNLYDFLLSGNLQPFAFRDGDVVVVGPRRHTFSVGGEVFNPYDFEFDVPNLTVERALQVARPRPNATHVSIVRGQGSSRGSEYYPLVQAGPVVLRDGDTVNVTADRYAGNIQVRLEGAHNSPHAMVLPYGATLKQVLDQLKPNALSRVGDIQLFRPSVATRQKEMLNVSLNKLEEATLSVRSATTEEASLRAKDADLIKQFIARARTIQPKGQVIIPAGTADSVILQEGDVLYVPEQTSAILVHGEVMFPNAIVWQPGLTAQHYINEVGGYTQSSDKSRLILIRPNGEARLVTASTRVESGDELMVLPKVTAKKMEITRALSTIIYQVAIAAKVILNL